MVWGVPFIVTLMVSPAGGCGSAGASVGCSGGWVGCGSLLSSGEGASGYGAGASVGACVGACVGAGVLSASSSTVMVCSGRPPAAP